MKIKHAFFAVLISCFAISCSKVTNGVPPALATNKFLTGADGPPLLFVNDVKMGELQGSLAKSKISPDNIESVTVLSPASTRDLVSRFGAEGKNGVILVTTKKVIK